MFYIEDKFFKSEEAVRVGLLIRKIPALKHGYWISFIYETIIFHLQKGSSLLFALVQISKAMTGDCSLMI
jgi:hypothetical protein